MVDPKLIFIPKAGGGSLLLTDIKTADYIAAVGEMVRVDTTVVPQAITITQPPNSEALLVGDRFGIRVEPGGGGDASDIRGLIVPSASGGFFPTPLYTNQMMMVYEISAITAGKSGPEAQWVLVDTSEPAFAIAKGRVQGFKDTADDTPTPILTFNAQGSQITWVNISAYVSTQTPTGGSTAQFKIAASFTSPSGVALQEFFNKFVSNISAGMAGVDMDAVVGSPTADDVTLRVIGLGAQALRWYFEIDIHIKS